MKTKKIYKNELEDPRWKNMSLKIISRDGCCQCCGSIDNLQAHHTAYIDNLKAWEYPCDFLITLCRKCHIIEHQYQDKIKFHIQEMRVNGILSKEIFDKYFKDNLYK